MTDSEKLDLLLSNMQQMQGNMQQMQGNMQQMQGNMQQMQGNMQQMDSKMDSMQLEINNLRQDVTGIQLHLENVTDKHISIIAENHCNLIDSLDKAIPRVSKELLYEVKVGYIEEAVKELKKAVKELQGKTA